MHHGDRLVLGPCRFIGVFIEYETQLFPNTNQFHELKKGEQGEEEYHGNTFNPLMINDEGIEIPIDNDKYEYSAVVSEMLNGGRGGNHGSHQARVFGSIHQEIEGKLWDDVNKAIELVNQANEIVSEMLVKVEFCVELATTLSSDFDHSQVFICNSLLFSKFYNIYIYIYRFLKEKKKKKTIFFN